MPLSKTTEVTLTIKSFSENQAKEIANYLQQLASNLDHESLKIIAQKSTKDKMNEKIKKFKHLL